MRIDLKGIIKQYGLIAAIIMAIIVVLVLRNTSNTFFKPDAFKHAEPTMSGSEKITPEKAGILPGNKLIVILDNSAIYSIPSASVVSFPPDSILEKGYLSRITNNKGPVLLASADQSVSARIWMILAQKGIEDLYILTSEDDEVLKNQFRDDTGIMKKLPSPDGVVD
jgi:hypothetical protein